MLALDVVRRPLVALVLVVLGACVPKVSAELPGLAEPAPPPVEKPEQQASPRIASVNGVAITTQQFRAIYDLKLQKYEDRGRQIPETAERRYQRSITDRLIYQEILRQEAAKRGIHHDEALLAEREQAQGSGIDDWEQHLRRRGESEDSLRQLNIAELLERAMLEADSALEITEAEVRAEYEKLLPTYTQDAERIHAAHILIRVGPVQRSRDDEPEPTQQQQKVWQAEATTRAQAIYVEASAPGADFAQLAREHSEGPSAAKGGDLGFFCADRMVDEFARVAFALAPGDVSKPVQTKFGVHIIKLYAKYPPGELPIDALEPMIREKLSARKLHQARRELKNRLLESYEIENIMDEILGPDPRRQARETRR